ncbi:MAG TPA: hypothetical protein VL243_07695 [Vicinamibacterales bacterium]|nr:hypothetical protein [Vicinamibacterales bacterium]
MDLVRQLLDKKVVDRHGREMGRVDSVILEIADHRPPVVSAIELSPSVLAQRVRPILGRWMEGLEHALHISAGRPLRIPFEVITIRRQVTADLAYGETSAAAVEHWLRSIVARIPRSS